MYFSLSWRNVWRDKRRTLIAAASVFFAVILAVLMRSGQTGSYAFMVDSASRIYTGHLQIQGEGYGDKFITDLMGRRNDIECSDVLSGVDALVEQGISDPERLAVMGWSYGGYLVNCLITKTTRFKAASSGAGAVDCGMSWALSDSPGFQVNFFHGQPWEVPQKVMSASPIYQVDKVKTPLLMHAGTEDARVPSSQAQSMCSALRDFLGVECELVSYVGEGHNLKLRSNRLAKMKLDQKWFEHHVLANKS